VDESEHGLGYELMNMMENELLHPQQCDIVLAIDHPGLETRGFYRLRSLFNRMNPRGHVIRLTASNLRLNNEHVDLLLPYLQAYRKANNNNNNNNNSSSNRRKMSERQSYLSIQGYPNLQQLVANHSNYHHNHQLHSKYDGDGGDDSKGRDGNNSNPLAHYPYNMIANHFYIPSTEVTHTLVTIRFTPSSLGISHRRWDTQNLLDTIQLLFPTSKFYGNTIDKSWNIPPPKTSTSSSSSSSSLFQRLIQLATVKVMSLKQHTYNNEQYRKQIQCIHEKYKQIVNKIQRNIFTVSGVIVRRDNSIKTSNYNSSSSLPSSAFSSSSSSSLSEQQIDANQSFITLRSTTISSSSYDKKNINDDDDDDGRPAATAAATTTAKEEKEDHVTIHGVFSSSEIHVLRELLAASGTYKLQYKKVLTIQDVTYDQRLIIQQSSKYNTLFPCPHGWFFDGQLYLNFNGDRQVVRPDIDRLVELYIHDENKRIQEYNLLLTDL
jgi:hypothetical protein